MQNNDTYLSSKGTKINEMKNENQVATDINKLIENEDQRCKVNDEINKCTNEIKKRKYQHNYQQEYNPIYQRENK